MTQQYCLLSRIQSIFKYYCKYIKKKKSSHGLEYFIFYLIFVDVYKLHLTNLIQNIFLHNKEKREKKKQRHEKYSQWHLNSAIPKIQHHNSKYVPESGVNQKRLNRNACARAYRHVILIPTISFRKTPIQVSFNSVWRRSISPRSRNRRHRSSIRI